MEEINEKKLQIIKNVHKYDYELENEIIMNILSGYSDKFCLNESQLEFLAFDENLETLLKESIAMNKNINKKTIKYLSQHYHSEVRAAITKTHQ